MIVARTFQEVCKLRRRTRI